ncbi:LysR family transcriptional regulator [Paenibacillus caui]|uniref:LysR family transcriptional regulator n=1 Tax=Paenibacillus caui TaxID=2873927 RepID=UPI001CA8339A|nr:LysR family transcriptional regulator [Paenibacillus caui]
MNLFKLQILVLIEKYKKVTDVARELQIKQPTVTFHMKSLEEELGVSLYQARGGRILLSEAGRSLYPYALKMTALSGEAARVLEQYKNPGGGLIRVGSEDLYAGYVLRGVRALKELNPELQSDIRLCSQAELGPLFADGAADAVIMEKNSAAPYAGFFEPLFEDEAVIICAEEHPWAKRGEVLPDEAETENFIRYGNASFLESFLRRLAEEQKIDPRSKVTVSSLEAAVQAAVLGLGVALATRKAVEGLRTFEQKIAVLPLPEALHIQNFVIGLLFRGGEPSSRIAQELALSIKEHGKS